MADESANVAGEAVRTAFELSASASTTGVSVSIKIDNPILAGIVSVGALSLGAYYLANRRPVENAVRNGLEIRNEAGVVDPEVRNIEEGSILVELHCHSEHSFIQFVEDFEAKKVEHRLKKEFTKIGFSGRLHVTIRNAKEVYRNVQMIRSSKIESKAKKVEDKEVQKASEGEKSKQPCELEEKESEQPSKQVTPENILTILEAQVKDLRDTVIEHERRKQMESKEKQNQIEELEQMKQQFQHVLKEKEKATPSPRQIEQRARTRENTTKLMTMSSDQLLEMPKDPLTPHHILKTKDDVGTCWYEVGVELGIGNETLQCIDRDYRTSEKKAQKVLEKWTDQNGKEATVGRLAYALITIGHKWIADKLFAMCHSSQPSEQEGKQSTQPNEREGGQSNQATEQDDESYKLRPGDREAEQFKYPCEQEGRQSKQHSKRGGEQFKPAEREASDDVFSVLAEVQELRKKVTGLKSQPKEHDGEQAKQPARWKGEQSKQQSEQETADDVFSLLSDVKELTKTAVERNRQRTEDETLENMIQDTKQMNIQVQQLIKKVSSESK